MAKDRREMEGRGDGSLAPRGHSRSLRAPRKRVPLFFLPSRSPGPSRFLDFRVFSNPRTENSWAGRAVEGGTERRTRDSRGEKGYSPYPIPNPLKQTRNPLNGERSPRLRQKKKLCEMTSRATSPPPVLLFSFHPPATPQLLPERRNPAVT